MKDRQKYEYSQGWSQDHTLPLGWMARKEQEDESEWKKDPNRIKEFESKMRHKIQKVNHVQFYADKEDIDEMIKEEQKILKTKYNQTLLNLSTKKAMIIIIHSSVLWTKDVLEQLPGKDGWTAMFNQKVRVCLSKRKYNLKSSSLGLQIYTHQQKIMKLKLKSES